MEPFLRVCDISYAYHSPLGATPALSGISFTVNKGEFLAIVGPSGCGKSTLLSLLAGLLTPEEGSVYIGDAPLKEAQAGIGYMLQRDHLFEWRTIRENAALGLEIRHRKTKAAMKTLDEMLENYGLAEFADAHPSELSGGMRQRAALIRTLALQPELLLLDEPFSALDYYLKEQLQFQVREVLRGYTGDVLMVSHSRDEVYRFCEKSIILNRGQVAMKGETRAIFQKPENVTAARLTGCKNFSRIRRIGEYEVEALDWGLTLQTEEAVAAEHAYIGIRAHQFYPARGSANEFTCEWGDTLCQPFEWDVLLSPVENAGAAGDKENALEREVIWWKVDYKQSDSLNRYQRGDRVRLGIAPGDIMLLKEG